MATATLAALLCACCLLLAAGAAVGGRVGIEDMLMMERFHAWQAAHNRSYATAAERLRRFEVYRRNMELIEATNRRGLSYRLGETPFSDLTSEEFLAATAMPRVRAHEAVRQLITTRAGPVSEGGGRRRYRNYTANDDVPESVDWRAVGAVTPAKNQMDCGSCWAFSTVATIESLHQITTGELVSLSEQEIIDCDQTPPDYGCDGGFPAAAMDWVASNGGLAAESEYPYESKQGTCRRDVKSLNHVAKIVGCQVVTPNNEEALEAAVAQQPVTIIVNADPMQQHYTSGVFDGPCDDTPMNHAIALVGYGADDEGRKYWIAKNSWGDQWGEDGFIRFARRVEAVEGMCGLASIPFYPVM